VARVSPGERARAQLGHHAAVSFVCSKGGVRYAYGRRYLAISVDQLFRYRRIRTRPVTVHLVGDLPRAAAKLVDQQYVRLIHIAVTSGLRAANRAAAQSGLGGAGPVLWRMPAG
jgi:hypothetical protein